METYPENIYVDELISKVPLQDLLNHTAQRLLKFINLPVNKTVTRQLILVVKYGFDGTLANSYKQKWNSETSNNENIFCSSLVPLQLIEKKECKIMFFGAILYHLLPDFVV